MHHDFALNPAAAIRPFGRTARPVSCVCVCVTGTTNQLKVYKPAKEKHKAKHVSVTLNSYKRSRHWWSADSVRGRLTVSIKFFVSRPTSVVGSYRSVPLSQSVPRSDR